MRIGVRSVQVETWSWRPRRPSVVTQLQPTGRLSNYENSSLNPTRKFNPDASLRANKTDNEKIFQSVSISVTRSEFNSELCFHDEVLRMTRGVKLLSSDGPAAAEPPDTTWTWWFVSESPVTEDETLLENTDNFTSVQQNYVRSRVTSVCGLKLNHHRYESFIDTKRLFTSSPCILQTAEIKGTICEICAEF